MKVRFIQELDHFGKPRPSSGWLTVGATYDVLAISLAKDGSWFLRILGDDAIPGLCPIESFEILCRDIPPSWRAAWIWIADGLYFKLAPAAWLGADFWDRFHDGEPEAERTFETELSVIRSASLGRETDIDLAKARWRKVAVAGGERPVFDLVQDGVILLDAGFSKDGIFEIRFHPGLSRAPVDWDDLFTVMEEGRKKAETYGTKPPAGE